MTNDEYFMTQLGLLYYFLAALIFSQQNIKAVVVILGQNIERIIKYLSLSGTAYKMLKSL